MKSQKSKCATSALLNFLAFAGMYLLGAFVCSLLYIIGYSITGNINDLMKGNPMENGWLMGCILLGSQIFPIAFFLWRKHDSYAIGGLRQSLSPAKVLGWSALLIVGIMLFNAIINDSVSKAFPDSLDNYSSIFSAFKNPIMIFCLSIGAPLCEELFFRGILERKLLEAFSPKVAIVASALVFAVYHLNIVQGVNAFIIGLFFGWLYYRTRSLWPSILCHFIMNTLVTIQAFAADDPTGGESWEVWIEVIMFVVGAAIIWFTVKKIAALTPQPVAPIAEAPVEEAPAVEAPAEETKDDNAQKPNTTNMGVISGFTDLQL